MKTIEINPINDLIFNIKAQEACKSCKRYGLTGCCPPSIGTFDYYKELIPLYRYGKLFVETFDINSEDYKKLGTESSLELHKVLLSERNKLFNEGHYYNLLLGGGSCKYCDKCVIPCRTPQFRAIPIEATGIDIVSTLRAKGIDISFPVKDTFLRVGILLWD
jgi:predicted metal-binding protein